MTDGAALDAALELAAKVAANGPLALIATKRDHQRTPGLELVPKCGRSRPKSAMPVLTSKDSREGAAAFAEKRKPNWTGELIHGPSSRPRRCQSRQTRRHHGGSGEIVTYRQLDERSNQCAHLFRSLGLQQGDTVAFCIENRAEFFDLVWGAQRSGLIYVAISYRLTASEMDYILADSGAKALVSSPYLGATLDQLQSPVPALYRWVAHMPGGQSYEAAVASMPTTPIADQRAGTDMLYSSGTTGQPKGVRLPLPEDPDIAAVSPLAMIAAGAFLFSADSIYLSPAPLYHAAPLRWCLSVHRLGGTVVRDGEIRSRVLALAAIEKYGITASQWVPTHFARMLKLPEEVRSKYDVSTPDQRRPRRRALPGADQGSDDQLVGAGHPRILCRDRRQWLHLHFERRLADA